LKVRRYKRARSFLGALRRSNKTWLDDSHWQVQWVFRGQRDAEKEPVPLAWRTSTIQKMPLYRDCAGTVSEEIAENVRSQWCHEVTQFLAVDGNESHVLRSWLQALPQIPVERIQSLIVQKKFEFLCVRSFVEVSDQLGLTLAATSFSRTMAVRLDYLTGLRAQRQRHSSQQNMLKKEAVSSLSGH
jgi:hypothetical protein